MRKVSSASCRRLQAGSLRSLEISVLAFEEIICEAMQRFSFVAAEY